MTMEQIASTMSAREFGLWLEAYSQDPFGNERGDMQAALIASTIANANAPKGKQFRLSDFMLSFIPKSLPSPDELRSKVLGIFGALVKGPK